MYSCDRHDGMIITYEGTSCPYCEIESDLICIDELTEENEELKAEVESLEDTMDELKDIINN